MREQYSEIEKVEVQVELPHEARARNLWRQALHCHISRWLPKPFLNPQIESAPQSVLQRVLNEAVASNILGHVGAWGFGLHSGSTFW